MSSGKGPRLHVEGLDDQYVIGNLLELHGYKLEKTRAIPSRPEIVQHKGVEGVFARLKTFQLEDGYTQGYVLDADGVSDAQSRWQAVRDILTKQAIPIPPKAPPDGFVGQDESGQKIGVWLMPDNQRSGAIEHFLQDLAASNDVLMQHAITATHQAKHEKGALFPDSQHPKAEIRAWLAWQKEPGCSYGTALAKSYFNHDVDIARAFVAWVKRLFEPDSVE